MSQITLNRPASIRRLDDVIESFESTMLVADPDVRDFLPSPLTVDNRHIAIELLCVDMQHRWNSKKRKTVKDYQRSFAEVLSSPEDLHELAREEYRLRTSEGEDVRAEEYRRTYGVDTSDWETIGAYAAARSDTHANINGLGSELVRLTDAIQIFPNIGDRIGDFELIDELGRGAFGIVFLARQGELEKRLVALKVTTLGDIESRYLARFQHTNIVPIYSIHRFGDLYGICMPFYGRDTLNVLIQSENHPTEPNARTRSNRERATDESTILRFGLQIAEGLKHAHTNGVVHRDLKPSNILLGNDGTAMLLDFNLSHDMVAGGRSNLMVGGTLPYLAPEHLNAIRTGDSIGPETDIYSLGVILYQLASGTLPYVVQTGAFDDVIDHMIRDRQSLPTNLQSVCPEISSGFATIVDRMLAPNRADRYSCIGLVCDDLKCQLDDLPLKHAPNVSPRERISKWCRRHPRLSSGTSVSAVALVLIASLTLSLFARGRQIDRHEALAQLNTTRESVREVRSLLSIPVFDDVSRNNGRTKAEAIADSYGMFDSENWREQSLYSSLAPDEQLELNQILDQTLFLLAAADSRSIEATEDEATRRALQSRISRIKQVAGEFSATGKFLGSSPKVAASSGYARVVRLLHNFQYEDAIAELEALRSTDPYDISTWLLLGNAYAGVGRLSDAESCFTVCVSMWPDSYLGYFHRGVCRLDIKMYTDAELDFNQVLQQDGTFTPALINRAVAERAQGRYQEAEVDLTRAIDLGATQTRIYFLRSEVRQRLGNLVGAKQDLELGLTLVPTDENSWIKRGLVHLKSDPTRALADFQAARKLNPRSHAALRNMAHIYSERLAQWDEALKTMNKLIGSHHHQTGDVVSRGVLLARLGRRDEAIRDAQSVLAADASAKEILQTACIFSLTSRVNVEDAKIAVSLLDRAITQDPKWINVAKTDSDLEPLRTRPDFKAVMLAAQQRLERDGSAMSAINKLN